MVRNKANFFGLIFWLTLGQVAVFSSACADALSNEPLRPLPLSLQLDPAKVELGRKLFNDMRLSGNGSRACSSCHILSKGMADGLPHSPGMNDVLTDSNTPSLFNSSYNYRQQWSGGVASLEELSEKVVENPRVMNAVWDQVVKLLQGDPAMQQGFQIAYKESPARNNIIDALATYIRSLITPNARIDRYLNGDSLALSPAEMNGYNLFKKYGCTSCHQGINIGGNMYQTFGVMGDYFAERGNIKPVDFGRYNVTKNHADRYVFVVPSLRNVAITAPYFHDGTAATLEKAVDIMFRYQLGRNANPQDKHDIVQFLHSLTGEYQGKSLELR